MCVCVCMCVCMCMCVCVCERERERESLVSKSNYRKGTASVLVKINHIQKTINYLRKHSPQPIPVLHCTLGRPLPF